MCYSIPFFYAVIFYCCAGRIFFSTLEIAILPVTIFFLPNDLPVTGWINASPSLLVTNSIPVTTLWFLPKSIVTPLLETT